MTDVEEISNDTNLSSDTVSKSSDSVDLYCNEISLSSVSSDLAYVMKEDPRWNLTTHHIRREYGIVWPREILWIKTVIASSERGFSYRRKALMRLRELRRQGSELAAKYLSCEFETRVGFCIPTDSLGWTLWLGNRSDLK
jgi:hypothetical protein